MRTPILSTFAVVLWAGSGVAAVENGYPRDQLLTAPAELATPSVAKQFAILDARSAEQYSHEHVPGARHVDHDAWKKAFGDGQDAESWGKRIGALGIGPGSKVVVYDDQSMKDAARIWWILRYWGVEDARLLNGGWNMWKAGGYATTDELPAPASHVEFNAAPRSQRLATKAQILELLNGNRLQIVDARSDDEFCGIDKKENKKVGAIPGAKHLEWSNLIDQETQRFKNADEMRRLLSQAGINLDRPTASHCQSGGRASVMAFCLELMGARDVRNYYRGWSEWGNSDDTPVAASSTPAGS